MQLQGKALRVTIFFGESNRYQGQSLSMALLEFLKRAGASGATVTRGLAGFGAHSRIHTATIVSLSEDLPLKLEWVDSAPQVEALLPQVRRMVDDGLIIVEEVNVVQYAPGRQPDPLGQPVRDVMRTQVVSVKGEATLEEVVSLLLRTQYRSLPVVTDDGRPIGIITEGDLLRRAVLEARLELQETLSHMQLQQQLAHLRQRDERAADIMTQPVITVSADDLLRVTVRRMIQHGLKRLPVVDGNQRLAGWISRVDVLRTLEYHRLAEEAPEEAVAQGGTVAETMYRDVPTVRPEAQLEDILQALEKNRRRRVLVVNGQQRVLGIITDGDLLRRSRGRDHAGLLKRLRNLISGRSHADEVGLPDSRETAAELMSTPVITITVDTSLDEALRLMLQHKFKRLPVVDHEGRLVGLLGRASLLQGMYR